jgi:hypothetical protein
LELELQITEEQKSTMGLKRDPEYSERILINKNGCALGRKPFPLNARKRILSPVAI